MAIFVLTPTLCWAQPSRKGDLTPSTPIEIYQNAQRAFTEKRIADGFQLLELAAQRGVLGARIEVARMYAKGDVVPRDDAKAFHYYKRIANDYADVDRRHALAQFVAEAFRMTATYLRNGIKSIDLRPNPVEASRLMLQSAGIYHEREAQYELATMFLNGEGVEKNPTIAIAWLVNSARKRYAPAQAVYGDMLWNGKDVKLAPVKGLALIALALDNADDDQREFVLPFYANATGEADKETILQAEEALQTIYKALRVRPDGPPLRIEQLPDAGKDMVMKDAGTGEMTSERAPVNTSPPASGGQGFGLDQQQPAK
ncbi:MAG: tetratricopeptide repeat protein [Hyphomicrobiales bacterium]|nr:tetratricopeptide repeat protein [Hyphomicrobiales bacterium]